jgi:serine/threonine protein kinase
MPALAPPTCPQVVDALSLLAHAAIAHFDLKCANVLVEPLAGVRDGQLWAPAGSHASLPGPAAAPASQAAAGATSPGARGGALPGGVPFRCVLADFGEARAYRCAAEAFTARNRGTEVFKSPEMLLMHAAPGGRPQPPPPATPGAGAGSSRPSSAAARSPAAGGAAASAAAAGGGAAGALSRAGLASDVWSLGCVAFELLAGGPLFGGDYASVTHRVAFGAGERLTLTPPERARLGGLQVRLMGGPQAHGVCVMFVLPSDTRRARYTHFCCSCVHCPGAGGPGGGHPGARPGAEAVARHHRRLGGGRAQGAGPAGRGPAGRCRGMSEQPQRFWRAVETSC